MRKTIVPAILVLAIGLAGASAAPMFLRGGSPSGSGATGTAHACNGGSTVCADFSNGQAFVTWTDSATGASGANFRYRMYRSTAALNSGNCTSGTLIAKYIFNNSGQLFGGSPDINLGTAFIQANRQANDASNPMGKIPDMTTGSPVLRQLSYGTGLQVYTALGTLNAYYCIVSTDTSDGTPVYIGAVGPIAESVATTKPVLYVNSASRPTVPTGQITAPTNLPLVLLAHASSSGGGAPPYGIYGDYWEFFGDTTHGYQDGRQSVFAVMQDNAGFYPGLTSALQIADRDTMWNSTGTGAWENFHTGRGYTPNALVGAANKYYPDTCNMIAKELQFTISNYGANANHVHWNGESLGAFGGFMCGMHLTNPHLGSVWMRFPYFRFNIFSAARWSGDSWLDTQPFRATVGSCTTGCLGTTASAIQFPDNSSWLNYMDGLTFLTASPGTDLPFAGWIVSKDDANLALTGAGSFQQHIDAKDAFETAHRGYAWVFNMGQHDTKGDGVIDCDSGSTDGTVTSVCYNKALFRLNIPYIAFDHSSINDNPGTVDRSDHGIANGDFVGCFNCGFHWNVTTDTSGAFNFTISNNWMTRSPTTIPTATLLSSLGPSGGATVNVNSTAGWLPIFTNNSYIRIGDEAMVITSKTSTTLVVSALRGQLNSTASAHSSGEAITQYPSQPTGPNGGPYATMTANVTPRRMQGFIKTNGTLITCTITPFGGSLTTQTPTVTNGLFTLSAVTINSGGNTTIVCS